MESLANLSQRIKKQVADKMREAQKRKAQDIAERLRENISEEAVQAYTANSLEIVDITSTSQDLQQIVSETLSS